MKKLVVALRTNENLDAVKSSFKKHNMIFKYNQNRDEILILTRTALNKSITLKFTAKEFE